MLCQGENYTENCPQAPSERTYPKGIASCHLKAPHKGPLALTRAILPILPYLGRAFGLPACTVGSQDPHYPSWSPELAHCTPMCFFHGGSRCFPLQNPQMSQKCMNAKISHMTRPEPDPSPAWGKGQKPTWTRSLMESTENNLLIVLGLTPCHLRLTRPLTAASKG